MFAAATPSSPPPDRGDRESRKARRTWLPQAHHDDEVALLRRWPRAPRREERSRTARRAAGERAHASPGLTNAQSTETRATIARKRARHNPERLRLCTVAPLPLYFTSSASGHRLRRVEPSARLLRDPFQERPSHLRAEVFRGQVRGLDLRRLAAQGLPGPRGFDADLVRALVRRREAGAVFAVFAHRPFERQRALGAGRVLHVRHYLRVVDLEMRRVRHGGQDGDGRARRRAGG